MKKLALLFVFVISSFSLLSQENDVTTYYLIRHAEKKDITETDKDPGINNEGIKRSENWAELFKEIPFDLIYTTDYKRTKQTAKVVADSKELPMLAYEATNLYDAGFKYYTTGKTVLIVGHSNTTPNFVNAILGEEKYNQIDENEYGNLYIVTVIGDVKTSTLLSLN